MASRRRVTYSRNMRFLAKLNKQWLVTLSVTGKRGKTFIELQGPLGDAEADEVINFISELVIRRNRRASKKDKK